MKYGSATQSYDFVNCDYTEITTRCEHHDEQANAKDMKITNKKHSKKIKNTTTKKILCIDIRYNTHHK